jgi:hypothetical protein
VCSDAVLVRELTVFLRCRGMLDRLIVPPVVVTMRCHAMVVSGGLMVRSCMVMMFARSMLELGHFGRDLIIVVEQIACQRSTLEPDFAGGFESVVGVPSARAVRELPERPVG